MSDQCLGEIRIFAGRSTAVPSGWKLCDGSLLPIAGNEALYALLGTTWGGDGRVNFGIPDLRGRLPIGQGQGPGLTMRTLGQKGGSETVTLTVGEIPAHTHSFMASSAAATTTGPSNGLLAKAVNSAGGKDVRYLPASPAPAFENMNPLSSTGGGQPHSNIMPCLGVNFMIALQGIFPQIG